VIQPVPVALLVALALAWLWRRSGRRGWLVTALLWVAYAVYEFLMYRRVLCSGECNIRVDLLLLYPALLGGTLWVGVAPAWRALRPRRGGADEA
jgi:hypothetical protein